MVAPYGWKFGTYRCRPGKTLSGKLLQKSYPDQGLKECCSLTVEKPSVNLEQL